MPFGILVNGKGSRHTIGTSWGKLTFSIKDEIRIPTQWYPDYAKLPKNSFTYFLAKKIP